MKLFAFALLVSIVLSAYAVLTTSFASSRLRRARRALRDERTRAAWAQARFALFDAAVNGSADARSETFRSLYRIQTHVLRRPHAFDTLAEEIIVALFDKGEPSAALRAERDAWSDEMKHAAQLTGEAILALLRNSSGVPAFIFRTADNLYRAAQHLGIRPYRRVRKLVSDMVPTEQVRSRLVATAQLLGASAPA